MTGKNKLWACATSAEALKTAWSYAYSYCCPDHCLIVSDEHPQGYTEVNDELGALLNADDWKFILSTADKLRREAEEQYHRQKMYEQEQFLSRFLYELKAERGETNEQKTEADDAEKN